MQTEIILKTTDQLKAFDKALIRFLTEVSEDSTDIMVTSSIDGTHFQKLVEIGSIDLMMQFQAAMMKSLGCVMRTVA